VLQVSSPAKPTAKPTTIAQKKKKKKKRGHAHPPPTSPLKGKRKKGKKHIYAAFTITTSSYNLYETQESIK
jgi:hypothetical protein